MAELLKQKDKEFRTAFGRLSGWNMFRNKPTRKEMLEFIQQKSNEKRPIPKKISIEKVHYGLEEVAISELRENIILEGLVLPVNKLHADQAKFFKYYQYPVVTSDNVVLSSWETVQAAKKTMSKQL